MIELIRAMIENVGWLVVSLRTMLHVHTHMYTHIHVLIYIFTLVCTCVHVHMQLCVSSNKVVWKKGTSSAAAVQKVFTSERSIEQVRTATPQPCCVHGLSSAVAVRSCTYNGVHKSLYLSVNLLEVEPCVRYCMTV